MFEELEEGEERRIGKVNALILLSGGQIKEKTLPQPNGGIRQKPMSFGAVMNLESVELEVERIEGGEWELRFKYQGEGGKVGESKLYWNGKKYEREKARVERKIREVFEELEEGEQTRIGKVNELIILSGGQIKKKTLPQPNGGVREKKMNFGAGKNLESVELEVERLEGGEWELRFKYQGESGNVGESKLYWNGKEYEGEKERMERKIREVFKELEEGEERRIGKVNELINLSLGQIKAKTLPQPDGGIREKGMSFGAVNNLEWVELEVERIEGGEWELRFKYQGEGGKVGESTLYWNGKKYEGEKERVERKIREVFKELEEGEERRIGKVNELIILSSGQIKVKTLPQPDGGVREKLMSFGAGKNLEEVDLTIHNENGKWVLEFRYKKEGEEDFRPEPVRLQWNPETEEYERYVKDTRQEVYEFDPEAEGFSLGEDRGQKTEVGSPNTTPHQEGVGQARVHGKQNIVTPDLIDGSLPTGRQAESSDKQDSRFRGNDSAKSQEPKTIDPSTAQSLGVQMNKEIQMMKISKVFQELRDGESRDVGDISLLINRTSGQLKKNIFPLPNGKKVATHQNVGLGKKLEEVRMTIHKKAGYWILDIVRKKEGKVKFREDLVQLRWSPETKLYEVIKEETMSDQIWKAFRELKQGQSRSFDDIGSLILFNSGQVAQTFPQPDGIKIGKGKSFGAKTGLTKVSLTVEKLKGEYWKLTMPYVKKDGSKGVGMLYWNGREYETEKERVSRKILKSYSQLQVGEVTRIGDVSALINLSLGSLLKAFPQPDGAIISNSKGFGMKTDLVKVLLGIKRLNEVEWELSFNYLTKNGESGQAKLYWNGSEYESEKEHTSRKIREAYEGLMVGEERHFENINSLIQLSGGSLLGIFPQPNGTNIGKYKALQSGGGLEKVDLALRKLTNREWELNFNYKKHSGEIGQSQLYWSGTAFETKQEGVVRKILEAFQDLNEEESLDIGDVGPVLNLTAGSLSSRFPQPDGDFLSGNFAIGAGNNLEDVSLRMSKIKDEPWQLEFTYKQKGGKEGKVNLYWNGRTYETPKEQKYRKISEAFAELKIGEIESIGRVDSIINMSNGQLYIGAPFPDGNTLKKPKGFGLGGSLEQVFLDVERKEMGGWQLKFTSYQKERKKTEQVLYWNGSEYETYQERTIRKIKEIFKKSGIGERQAIQDVSSLMNMTKGQLSVLFPQPEGGVINESKGLRLGGTLDSVNLEIIRLNKTEWKLNFIALKENGELKEGSLYWNGVEYETEKERVLRKIKAVFRDLGVGEGVNVVDVSSLVSMTYGDLQSSFPQPDMKPVGRVLSLGGVQNLKQIDLKIKKLDEQSWELTFEYVNEFDVVGESVLLWNGSFYDVTKKQESAVVLSTQGQVKRTEISKELSNFFKNMNEDESRDVGNVNYLINMDSGRLASIFPQPDGKSINASKNLVSGIRLKDVVLRLTKLPNQEWELNFNYVDRKGRKGEVKLYWNGEIYQTVKERKAEMIRKAFRRLSEGESEVIADINQLVSLSYGALSELFPQPDETKLQKRIHLGVRKGLKQVGLEVTKLEGEEWLLIFDYKQNDGVKDKVEIYWNGNEYESKKQRVARKVVQAYSELREGEGMQIGNVNPLILLSGGALLRIFPRPDGSKIEKETGFGVGNDLTEVELEIVRLQYGEWKFNFKYKSKTVSEGEANLYWNGEEFETEDERLRRVVSEVFQKIKVGEIVKVGNINSLVTLSIAQLVGTFPTPDGGVLGYRMSFGAKAKLRDVDLEIRKSGERVYELVFNFEQQDGEKGSTLLYWDGIRYETEKHKKIREIKEVFSNLNMGESTDVGDITSLITLYGPQIRWSFPQPNGKNIGEQTSFGGEKGLTKVALIIKKINSEEWRLDFIYKRKEGDERTAQMYWNGSKYEREDLRAIRKMKQAFLELKDGESREIGRVNKLFHLSAGQLKKRFPTPINTVIGEIQTIGLGHSVEEVNLTIHNENRKWVLEFEYKKEGEEGFRPEPVRLQWNPETEKYEPYVKDIQQAVYEFDPDAEGFSLGEDRGQRTEVGRQNIVIPDLIGDPVSLKQMDFGLRGNDITIDQVIQKYPIEIQRALQLAFLMKQLKEEGVSKDSFLSSVNLVSSQRANVQTTKLVYQIMDFVTFRDRLKNLEGLVGFMEEGGLLEVAFSSDQKQEVMQLLGRKSVIPQKYRYLFQNAFKQYGDVGKQKFDGSVRVILMNQENIDKVPGKIAKEFLSTSYESRYLKFVPGASEKLSVWAIQAAQLREEAGDAFQEQFTYNVLGFYSEGDVVRFKDGKLIFNLVEILTLNYEAQQQVLIAA